MHAPLLTDILIILCASVAVVLLFQRFRIPSILGLLFTGVLIGPEALGWVTAIKEVEVLSEIGVILLLFVIGMELSLKQLKTMRRTVFIGGGIQVGLTVGIVAALAFSLDFSLPKGLFMGFLVSLSSTAIVLKVLQENNEMHAPHGRVALGVLIFQDIIVVPMMLVTPLLAGKGGNPLTELALLLGKSVVVVGGVLYGARSLVPRLFSLVAKTQNRGLFILTTMALCFAVATLTGFAGLSLALGAFLAGLVVSESEYSHQATSTILPFRELFTSFFFVSIGMLLDVAFFLQNLYIILPAVAGVFLLKSIVAGLATALLRYPPRTCLMGGLALFQIGEFAFILSRVGIDEGLLSDDLYQYFLSISILSMAATPFVILYSEAWVSRLLKRPSLKKKVNEVVPERVNQEVLDESGHCALHDHLVIIGFGLNGRNVARAAHFAGIDYAVMELNARTVEEERERGEPIFYGDPVQAPALEEINIEQARIVVIAISDPKATQNIVVNIREYTQTAFVLVRTRFVGEVERLCELGADEVIPEEFETSVEMFTRVLHRFLVPMDQVEQLARTVRSDNYEVLRPRAKPLAIPRQASVSGLNIQCVQVLADSGPVAGRSIQEADIRRHFGVTILALQRNGDTHHHLTADTKIHQHDRVFLTGPQEAIDRFYQAVS